MDKQENSCPHLDPIEDHHEGIIVCTACGLVMTNLYLTQIENNSYEEVSSQSSSLHEIQHLLDRMHVPVCYASNIESYYRKNFTTKSNKSLIFSVYRTLNKLGIPVSMKEISNVADVPKSKLNKIDLTNNCMELNPSTLVDKYCGLLGLNFKIGTLIKRSLDEAPISGHNPNSVLASTIYQVCKKERLKLSIKKISEVTSVSCISIQRYNNFYKNVHCS